MVRLSMLFSYYIRLPARSLSRSCETPEQSSGVLRDVRAFAVALLVYGAFYGAFFWTSLASGDYIAPSDSLDFGVAAYLSPFALWTEGMYSGYPIAADPQSLTWYPVFRLFRLIGADWNLFLISAYAIASATCFLFVRRLTGSNVAGILGGITYGFGGNMLAHIGHFNQIHTAAWVPLALYGLQVIREGYYRAGTAAAATGFALLWLAGHPQVPVYTTYLATALIIGQTFIDRPARDVAVARAVSSIAAMALGFILAGVTVIPMVELGQLSGRAESNWELYISKALPPRQLLGLILPFAFGGLWHDGSVPVEYFGAGAPQENTGYVGLLPFSLALAALCTASSRRREIWLWIGLFVIAALLCLGDATPVGTLFYYAPGYARFRVPARHLFVTSLGLAVISGMAWRELTRRREGWSAIAAASLAIAAIALVAFGALAWRAPDVRAALDNEIFARWVPGWSLTVAGLLALCAVTARVAARGRYSLAACAAIFVALHVAELTEFHYRNSGTRLEYADVPRAEAIPHSRIRELRNELQRTGERVLSADGSKNPFILPNLTRPWNLPAASGTGSLSLERYSQTLGMGGPGDVYPETLSPSHRALDLFSVRYTMVRSNVPLAQQLRDHPERWTPLESLQYYDHDPDTAYTLFRNERALPRAWCVSSVVRVTPDEALSTIRMGHLPAGRGEFWPSEVALVEDDDLRERFHGHGPSGRSEVVAQFDQRRYLVQSDIPCVLVLSEVYYPWWRASVDDVGLNVARVNHTMIGVPVPAGSHVVRLWQRATSVWIGGAVSAIGALMWIGLGCSAFIRNRRVRGATMSDAPTDPTHVPSSSVRRQPDLGT
jgi:hypothetical protein